MNDTEISSISKNSALNDYCGGYYFHKDFDLKYKLEKESNVYILIYINRTKIKTYFDYKYINKIFLSKNFNTKDNTIPKKINDNAQPKNNQINERKKQINKVNYIKNSSLKEQKDIKVNSVKKESKEKQKDIKVNSLKNESQKEQKDIKVNSLKNESQKQQKDMNATHDKILNENKFIIPEVTMKDDLENPLKLKSKISKQHIINTKIFYQIIHFIKVHKVKMNIN